MCKKDAGGRRRGHYFRRKFGVAPCMRRHLYPMLLALRHFRAMVAGQEMFAKGGLSTKDTFHAILAIALVLTMGVVV